MDSRIVAQELISVARIFAEVGDVEVVEPIGPGVSKDKQTKKMPKEARELILAARILLPAVSELVANLADLVETGYKEGRTDEDTISNRNQWLRQVSVASRTVLQLAKSREYAKVRRTAKQIVQFCQDQRQKEWSGGVFGSPTSGKSPVPYLNQRIEHMINSMPAIKASMRTAGGAFANHSRGITRAHSEIYNHLEMLDGLFHYRLYGDGAKDTFTGEPTLTPEQTKEAKDMQKKMAKVKDEIGKAYNVLKEFGREAKKLDKYMMFD